MTSQTRRNLYPKKKLTRADASMSSMDLRAQANPKGLTDQSGNRSLVPSQYAKDIVYPNGERIKFDFDPQGHLIKIHGFETWLKRGDHWYLLEPDGNLRILPYHNHSLLKNGDLLLQTGERRFHGRRTDGSEYNLRLTALGAYSQTDAIGRVEMIVRSDGSLVSAIYIDPDSPPNIQEVSSDQKQRLLWTRDCEYFHCAGQANRYNLELSSNGNLSFVQESDRIIITGDGIKLSEPVSRRRYSFDEEGRIVQIDYGDKLRQFSFIEKTRELASVAVMNLSLKSTFYHERIGTSDEWSVRDHYGNLYATWCGRRHLTANGDYVYQERSSLDDDDRISTPHICRPDGSESQAEIQH